MNNAAKHSGASRVVRHFPTEWQAEDADRRFWQGIRPNEGFGGFGLESMRERMHLVNGELLVSSNLGGGTELVAQVILKQSFEGKPVAVA